MYVREELMNWPVENYQDKVRPILRSGDLLFASGNFVFSNIIKWASKSMWSHVGIVFALPNQYDRVLVLESVEVYGVRLAPLSKYLTDYWRNRPYRGSVYVARYAQDFPQPEVIKALQKGVDLLTRRYGYLDLLRISQRMFLGTRFFDRKHEFICSELVETCFQEANVAFSKKDDFLSPEDIAADKNVNFLHRIL